MKKFFIATCLISASFMSMHSFANDGAKLFKTKTCVVCHSVENRMVGPSLKEIAAKNDGVAGAAETIALHIKEGSTGVWGPIPMPRNAVSNKEALILANWVLGHK